MLLYKRFTLWNVNPKIMAFIIASSNLCPFPILGPEIRTYWGIESDKYTTLSAINTFFAFKHAIATPSATSFF